MQDQTSSKILSYCSSIEVTQLPSLGWGMYFLRDRELWGFLLPNKFSGTPKRVWGNTIVIIWMEWFGMEEGWTSIRNIIVEIIMLECELISVTCCHVHCLSGVSAAYTTPLHNQCNPSPIVSSCLYITCLWKSWAVKLIWEVDTLVSLDTVFSVICILFWVGKWLFHESFGLVSLSVLFLSWPFG